MTSPLVWECPAPPGWLDREEVVSSPPCWLTGRLNGPHTCPVPDGQVVSLLQDNVQLVHRWTRRVDLCITGTNDVDALERQEVTQVNKNRTQVCRQFNASVRMRQALTGFISPT